MPLDQAEGIAGCEWTDNTSDVKICMQNLPYMELPSAWALKTMLEGLPDSETFNPDYYVDNDACEDPVVGFPCLLGTSTPRMCYACDIQGGIDYVIDGAPNPDAVALHRSDTDERRVPMDWWSSHDITKVGYGMSEVCGPLGFETQGLRHGARCRCEVDADCYKAYLNEEVVCESGTCWSSFETQLPDMSGSPSAYGVESWGDGITCAGDVCTMTQEFAWFVTDTLAAVNDFDDNYSVDATGTIQLLPDQGSLLEHVGLYDEVGLVLVADEDPVLGAQIALDDLRAGRSTSVLLDSGREITFSVAH